jgi:hypothetical protein
MAARPNRMNAINVISPYKDHGMWVFDDARVGLVQEPFVSGADTWIDRVVADTMFHCETAGKRSDFYAYRRLSR